MKKQYVVEVELPKDVSSTEMIEYIKQWVATGRGACHPEDPMSELNRESIKVFPRSRTKK